MLLVVAYTLLMKGWIYIMSNASFSDGRIKIGMSSKDPVERKSELESSGVPEPFVIEYKAMVDDYQKVEQTIHRSLDNYRPNKKREFFTCTIPEAIITIRSSSVIAFEENNYQAPEEIEEIIAITQRQERTRLFMEEAKRDELKRAEEEASIRNAERSQRLQPMKSLMSTVGLIGLFYFMFIAVKLLGNFIR